MVEGGGFEPPKAPPTDLQSVPFDRSGTPPLSLCTLDLSSLFQYVTKYILPMELAMGLEPATC